MFIITLAEVTMVTSSAFCSVALAPATDTVSSALTLGIIVPLTGCLQGVLIFIPDGALTELTNEAFTAAALRKIETFFRFFKKQVTLFYWKKKK